MNGAHGTLYANETYQLQVDFPENYPMEAPQVLPVSSDIVLLSILLFFWYNYVCIIMVLLFICVIGWMQVIFLQPAPLHPHIYSNGHICLGNPEDVPLGFGTLEILKWFHFFSSTCHLQKI